MTPEPMPLFDDTIQARFASFHVEHPEVYAELVRLARKAKRQGRRGLGIGCLWEVMRWTFWLRDSGDKYKLNNDMRSRYARLLMDREPDLAKFFNTRELRTP